MNNSTTFETSIEPWGSPHFQLPDLDHSLFVRAVESEICKRSLAEFVKGAWHVVEPGVELTWNWHLDAICEHLQAVTEGRIKRLIINIAPGMMKSLLVSVFWPAWEWTFKPDARTLFGSYDANLAIRDSMKCRDILLSDWYQTTFDPAWRLKGDQNAKQWYVNTQQGFRMCVSVGGQRKTGWRGDKLVMDDPLPADAMFNRAAKEHAIWVWDKVLSTRVNNLAKAAFVLIMQRLADDDLAGHLIRRGGYDLLKLPTEFVPEDRASTSIGWSDPRTYAGELLFPELFPEEAIEGLKEQLGPEGYSAQHQQEPVPSEGARFKAEWIHHWIRRGDDLVAIPLEGGDERLIRLSQCHFFTSQDVAVSEATVNDATVIEVWAVTPKNEMLMMGVLWERLEDPDAVQAAVDMANHYQAIGYPIRFWAVEQNGVGKPRCQHMRERGLAVLPINISRDKYAMSATASIRMKARQVFFPPHDECPQLLALLNEHLLFPYGSHDDTVTATSLAAECIFPFHVKIDAGGTRAHTPRPTNERRDGNTRVGLFGQIRRNQSRKDRPVGGTNPGANA